MTERVADSDPEDNEVLTDRGKAVACDFLILATGLALNCAGTEGMDTARIGQNGIGSICHSPQAATATWQAMSVFAEKGGLRFFQRHRVRAMSLFPGTVTGLTENGPCTERLNLRARRRAPADAGSYLTNP